LIKTTKRQAANNTVYSKMLEDMGNVTEMQVGNETMQVLGVFEKYGAMSPFLLFFVVVILSPPYVELMLKT
jgi:hypothetical protein